MNASDTENSNQWSPIAKRLATVLILIYLFVLVIGPMTNPNGSPYLTTPVAQFLSPVHQALFMGHGYRFFGPDPGPSHSVLYKIHIANGDNIEGHFPDRDQISPRLRYHRWFMLSETLFREGANLPNDAQLKEQIQKYNQQIEEYQVAGHQQRDASRLRAFLQLGEQLEREKDQELSGIERGYLRRDLLVKSIAKNLLKLHDGERIELAIQERRLATPEEVLAGLTLDDQSFISIYEIGTFSKIDFDSSKKPSQLEVIEGNEQ